jgi:hypothetical protein
MMIERQRAEQWQAKAQSRTEIRTDAHRTRMQRATAVVRHCVVSDCDPSLNQTRPSANERQPKRWKQRLRRTPASWHEPDVWRSGSSERKQPCCGPYTPQSATSAQHTLNFELCCASNRNVIVYTRSGKVRLAPLIKILPTAIARYHSTSTQNIFSSSRHASSSTIL